MKDKEILVYIRSGIDEMPINILDNIKSTIVVKMIEHDDITRQDEKKSIKPLMSFVSVAAVFLLVFFNIQEFRLPDSHIYLDINPSIHITTNKRDNVIDLVAINNDAIGIIEGIEYKGKDLDIVTEEIMNSIVDKSYFNNDYDVMLVSVYNKDSEKSKNQVDKLNRVIKNKLDANNAHPIILSQSLDKSNTVEEFAEEYGVSIGKMTYIRNLIIQNPELKTEELVYLSLNELIKISQNTGIGPLVQEKTPTLINDEDDDDENDYKDHDDDDWDDHDKKNKTKSIKKRVIGEARAKEIALELANGKIVKFEFDDDDDDPEYKFEIIAYGYEYEIEIDAFSGKVIKFKQDDYDEDDDDDDDHDHDRNDKDDHDDHAHDDEDGHNNHNDHNDGNDEDDDDDDDDDD